MLYTCTAYACVHNPVKDYQVHLPIGKLEGVRSGPTIPVLLPDSPLEHTLLGVWRGGVPLLEPSNNDDLCCT